MKTISEILMKEHRQLDFLQGQLEAAAEAADIAESVRVIEALDESLYAHRGKEENLLFPALRWCAVVHPIALETVAREHGTEQKLVDEVKAMARASEDDPSFLPWLKVGVERLALHLRDHMRREEKFVFAWAEQVFPESEKRELAARMSAQPVPEMSMEVPG